MNNLTENTEIIEKDTRWFVMDENGEWEEMSYDTAFEKGETYRMNIILRNPVNFPASIKVHVNGVETPISVHAIDAHMGVVNFEIQVPENYINITETKAPVVGAMGKIAPEFKFETNRTCKSDAYFSNYTILVEGRETARYNTNADHTKLFVYVEFTAASKGDATKTFRDVSGGSLTRQQMAAFFYRYAGYLGMDTSTRGDLSSLLNADKVSDYEKDSIGWMVGTGLLSGSKTQDANGSTVYDLAPRAGTTRAQLAAILMRFCQNF